MSVICENCGKKFTKERGLVVHQRSCKAIEEVEVYNELPEEKETIVEASSTQETGIELSEKIQGQIKKLRDLRASTYDALTRHKIDLQIEELQRG